MESKSNLIPAGMQLPGQRKTAASNGLGHSSGGPSDHNCMIWGRLRLLQDSAGGCVIFDWRAATDQVAVAIHVVDTADGAPIFVHAGGAFGEAAFLARVAPRPVIDRQIEHGVGRGAGWGFVDGEAAGFDIRDLAANAY